MSPELLRIRTRGARDLLPAEMRAFRRVEDAFRQAALRWGYEEIRTPVIEPFSLFTVAGALTPAMLSRVYSFLDWDGWSGERVVLRPDSTIPVARAVADGGLKLPARVFYVQNRFRFPAGGEDAESWQCGLEHLGAPTGVGDLEVISVGCEALEALGFSPTIRLSHVGVGRALLAMWHQPGTPEHQELLDLLAEEGLGAISQRVRGEAVERLLPLLLQPGERASYVDNLLALSGESVPGVRAPLEELRAAAQALEASGRQVVIDLSLPCDFEYYDGLVFEFVVGGEPRGRGGRYRPPIGSCDTACGLGLDATELAAALADGDQAPFVAAVVPATEDDIPRAIEVARALHRSGLSASLEAEDGAAAVVVRVGRNEVRLRAPGEERPLRSLDELVEVLLRFK